MITINTTLTQPMSWKRREWELSASLVCLKIMWKSSVWTDFLFLLPVGNCAFSKSWLALSHDKLSFLFLLRNEIRLAIKKLKFTYCRLHIFSSWPLWSRAWMFSVVCATFEIVYVYNYSGVDLVQRRWFASLRTHSAPLPDTKKSSGGWEFEREKKEKEVEKQHS